MEEITKKTPPNNTYKNTSLIRIGNFIKEARVSRNQTTKELASSLKISEGQLKAIEEGRDDLLPEKVFIKAMVKRISEKLKLDTKFILGEFDNQKEEVPIEDIVEEVSKEIKGKPKQNKENPLGFILIIFLSGLVGLFASSLFFDMLFDSFQNDSNKEELIKKN